MKCRLPKILAAAVGLALVVPTTVNAAAPDPVDRFQKAPSSGRVGTSVVPRSVRTDQAIDVIVELTGDPVAVVQARSGRVLSRSERSSVRSGLARTQGAVGERLARDGAKVLTRMQSAVNALRVRTTAGQLSSIASIPGVKAVHAVPRHTMSTAVSVPFLGVPEAWASTGFTGAGVKVAIIDTGIDYTHKDFAGPGTTAAYDTAHAAEAQQPDPTLFGPAAPRVKGGYDFVGDGYNADDPDAAALPDTNPLDCNGHGTHVAGIAAGSGVLSDGTTYAGSYDATTSQQDFRVGPGVAPQADLYALRVFGCEGSTDYTTEAIDWAVAHQMDVINMSLGSPFGRADDVDAVAASNAVAAGVVVVASAGNEGPSPYLTGTPGAAHGVVSVAAIDSTATFPGAQLDYAGGGNATAINANGANLPAGPYHIVVVKDDPATDDVDESLGCSTAAFTQAGIATDPAPLQLAVVQRGTCARAAKAIFGQQAGADAVLMVNNTDAFPPYEGAITVNPDDGTPFDVTIPFLGVPSGTTVPDGDEATLSSATLENPGFTRTASFSSGGPRSGDSGLAPSVSAPGVSISSAGSGSGAGAEVLSGTSMAAPHVAGMAALAVQAHPTWSAADLSAAIVSTADPEKVEGYRLLSGGNGLIDVNQALTTQVLATGDSYTTEAGKRREAVLSFGFVEPSSSYAATHTITLVNRGRKAVTYSVAVNPSAGNVSATASLSSRRVRVPAHGSASVKLRLSVSAAKVGSSVDVADDQWAFRQVSGSVRFTAKGSVLRVPYLLVPRAQAKVASKLTSANPWLYEGTTPSTQDSASVNLKNPHGALDASAEVFTWGLSDGRDVEPVDGNRGIDLRAAGVETIPTAEGPMVVFAVNTFTRASNASANEFDVNLDTDADGKTDLVVFSADSGYIRSDGSTVDGYTEVFIYDVASGKTTSSGFLATAPTDSSTVLLPVYAEDLGLTEVAGTFSYRVTSSSLQGPWTDKMGGLATYDPYRRAVADAAFVEVARNGSIDISVAIDPIAQAEQRPRGLMVVVFDNKSGQAEAALLGR